jgi:hypothetical protein
VRVEQAHLPWGLESMREPLALLSGARVVTVSSPLVCLTRPDLHTWFTTINDRTTLEARGTLPERDVSLRRAAKRWTESYLLKGGWSHGREGWRVALLEAIEGWLLTEKAWEATAGGGTTVRATYDEMAAALVEGPPD